MAAFMQTEPASPPRLPVGADLRPLRDMPVQHDGRWPPMDTLARDMVSSVTGSQIHQEQDPLLLLLSWTFEPQAWLNVPLVKVSNANLRELLELPADRTVFSYLELFNHQPLRMVLQSARGIGSKELDDLQKKAVDIEQKLSVLSAIFSGEVIRPIPNPQDGRGHWSKITIDANTPRSAAVQQLSEAWMGLQSAFVKRDAAAILAEATAVRQAADALPAKYKPSTAKMASELHYNRFAPFTRAWHTMALATLISVLAIIFKRRWVDHLAVVAMLAGLGLIVYGLYLRWGIAGRIPSTNMYESMLFLGLGMGVFAVFAMLFIPVRIVPLSASAMGALSLCLADVLPLDPFVRPAAPALMDTYWMSIHVPIIMLSYSVLALAALFAHGQLFAMAFGNRESKLNKLMEGLHYWYVHTGSLLLWAGIATGSMWAASSWGRYWGWDPKEVWSLVALLGYLAILHIRLDNEKLPTWTYALAAAVMMGMWLMVIPLLRPSTKVEFGAILGASFAMVFFVVARGPFAAAIKSVVAYWLIIMTYVGVNFVLGRGLHSYGFGKGAVVDWLYRLAAVDLAVIVLVSIVFLWRQQKLAPAAAPSTTPEEHGGTAPVPR
jgi:ABC-type transport system involved in cytochrome c biogenesis permease subunit